MTAESHRNDVAALAEVTGMLSGMLCVPAARISPDQRLIEDLAMDSLELIELAMELDARWNIQLDRARLADVATVADVAAWLDAATPPNERAAP
ncbi:acyl carrier protein [Burkholderia alba]|uniref:acyl carrier protein n=1 Tax=Burkholderia alba TaxID=2683677 RepID=UPI002B0541DA|nr:phosphopantetheine-binding protein [Burkholderia alba]